MGLLIGDLFRRNAAVVPNAVAASFGDATLTHRELDAAGNAVAHALRAHGIRRGDRVLSWADTGLEVLPLFVALAKLGAVFAPLDARLRLEEATDVARSARAQLLVADAAHVEAALAVAQAADIARIGHLGAPRGPGLELGREALGASTVELREPALDERDPHVIFFTSGSTGRPKGVVLSHRANHLRTFQGVFRDAPERSVCMFPLFHMAAFTLALAAWQTRGEIAFVASPTAEALLAATAARRANRLYCIPAVFARILETRPGAFDVSSLREVDTGTSATPIELLEALKQRFPATATRVYYGSTECGAGAVLPDVDVLRKPGSVGPPAPGVELRLTEDGEICLRSDYLMDGYFDDAEATAASLRDGWYHTGDRGSLDDEGYLSIVGRLRDVIRSGGETIGPGEVEAVLEDHPAVAEIAVVGVPDLRWGEVVCAVAVPRPGASLRLEDLQRHCEGRLAPFKKPRRLEIVDALPRTPATAQIQRALIVQRLATRAP